MTVLVFVNNPISGMMAEATLEQDGLSPRDAVLFLMRQPPPQPWFEQCGEVIRYPAKASLTLLGQTRFVPFYFSAARRLREFLNREDVTGSYIVNSDNLLTNHILNFARKNPTHRVTVLAEGLMNYQDIRTKNRAWWRAATKPLIASGLGLQYVEPTTHLSGAFDPAVSRVVSFAEPGLKAPPEIATIVPLKAAQPVKQADPGTVMYVETALWQWMSEERFRPFAEAFAAWLKRLAPKKLLVKPHPNYPASAYLRSLLPPFEIVTDRRSIEEMAPEMEAGTVVGTCCTGLITLRLIRPDLRAIDFGSDHYLEHAYHGDTSVRELMLATGVELALMSQDASVTSTDPNSSTSYSPSDDAAVTSGPVPSGAS